MNKEISVRELQLGDIIIVGSEFPYNYSTVIKVTDEFVETVRPYIHTSDMACLAYIKDHKGLGLIDYTGTERMLLWTGESRTVTLVQRRTVKVL